MAGKQKGSSSRSLSSDNDPILRDSNISDKIDALSNKFDSKFDELDSKFSSLHNEFSSSNVRMQACETQGTALAADLNAVKADTGLTDPLFRANMANMLATTQRLTIEKYNTIYYYDQPERAENSKCRVLRLAVGGTLPTDLPTLSNLLCCAPSLITQATPQRPNSQGKARLLVQFKDQAAATAAAASSKPQSHSRVAGPEAHIPAKRAGRPSHPTAAGSTGGRTRASHLPGRGRVGVGLHRLQGIRSSSTQGLPLHPPLPWRTAPRPRLSLQLSRHSHCH